MDTLFIGTATALIILLTGTFDVCDGAGNLLLDQTGGIEAGIKWTQYALMNTFGTWSGKALAIIIVLFVFTSMTGYCYQAEANIRYLTHNSKLAVNICRAVFLAASCSGAIVNADAIWSMGDIGYGTHGLVQYHCHRSVGWPKASVYPGGLRTAEEGRQESGLSSGKVRNRG